MDIANRKLQLMEQLMGVISLERIEKIENFFKKEIPNNSDVWDDMPDVVQQLVNKGLEESKAGNTISHNEVMAKVKAKYKIA
jgi:hypothetical protein